MRVPCLPIQTASDFRGERAEGWPRAVTRECARLAGPPPGRWAALARSETGSTAARSGWACAARAWNASGSALRWPRPVEAGGTIPGHFVRAPAAPAPAAPSSSRRHGEYLQHLANALHNARRTKTAQKKKADLLLFFRKTIRMKWRKKHAYCQFVNFVYHFGNVSTERSPCT